MKKILLLFLILIFRISDAENYFRSANFREKSAPFFYSQNYLRTRRFPQRDFFSKNYARSAAKIVARAVRQRKTISEISEQKIPLFQISAKNSSFSRSTDFVEALLLQKINFKILNNSGAAENPENFSLVINETEINFDKNGEISAQLQNARIAVGENLLLEIFLKIRDPEIFPRKKGRIRVKISDATATTELSHKKISAQILGENISHFVDFDPIATATKNSFFAGNSGAKIFGKTLISGEKTFVLRANFFANYDDLKIRKIKIFDEISGDAIDFFTKKIRAIDLQTGEIFGETKFLNSAAEFNFWPEIRVDRGDEKNIGFEIEISEKNLPAKNAHFQLKILPENVVAFGTNGKNLKLENKFFSILSDEFSVASATLQIFPTENQIQNFAANENLEQIFRFSITNPGARPISIARISMNLWLEGAEFSGGISDDDAEIVQISGENELGISQFFSRAAGPNFFIFDAKNEFVIEKNSVANFVLKLKLKNVKNDRASVAVRILGDQNFSAGTAEKLKNENKNFIWSDFSAPLHDKNSPDFFSGFLLDGLPTNLTVIKKN